VQSFKSVSARRINALRGTPGAPVWQRNYYEHVVRDEHDLARIREYIRTNPARWDQDSLHP
jgi:REP element-mobilizing transposase RayT